MPSHTSKPRLSQSRLIRAQRALSELIRCVHEARQTRFVCQDVRPGKLVGLSRLLKKMVRQPHTSDYREFEVELKRKLIGALRRLHGYRPHPQALLYAIVDEIPEAYEPQIRAFDEQARALLRVLADVGVRRPVSPDSGVFRGAQNDSR